MIAQTLKPFLPEIVKRPLRKLMTLQRELPTYRHWKREFRDDALFDVTNLERGLRPHATSPTRTPEQRLEVASRLVAAYHRASADLARQSAVYKVSNEWVPIYRKPLRPLLDVLERGDALGLRDLMDNFFRSSVSLGLCGLGVDMAGLFFDKEPSQYLRNQLLIDSVYRYRLVQKLVPGLQPADLHIENFGNPYGWYVDDKFLRTGVDYQYYYGRRVSEILGDKPGVVAELGGGIGGFAYFLSKLHRPGLTYINLDLPEILCISSYQLLNLFPEKSALLYGEVECVDSATVAKYDLALLPSFVVESLDADSVDVSFNSYSLAEMDEPTIANYTAHLSRISRKAIYHVNHVRNSLVSADRFPFDASKFEFVSRTRASWNMGRNLHCDEYEFLLQRRA